MKNQSKKSIKKINQKNQSKKSIKKIVGGGIPEEIGIYIIDKDIVLNEKFTKELIDSTKIDEIQLIIEKRKLWSDNSDGTRTEDGEDGSDKLIYIFNIKTKQNESVLLAAYYDGDTNKDIDKLSWRNASSRLDKNYDDTSMIPQLNKILKKNIFSSNVGSTTASISTNIGQSLSKMQELRKCSIYNYVKELEELKEENKILKEENKNLQEKNENVKEELEKIYKKSKLNGEANSSHQITTKKTWIGKIFKS